MQHNTDVIMCMREKSNIQKLLGTLLSLYYFLITIKHKVKLHLMGSSLILQVSVGAGLSTWYNVEADAPAMKQTFVMKSVTTMLINNEFMPL